MESEVAEGRAAFTSEQDSCRRYSLRQLADIANVSPRRIRSWVRAGLLSTVGADHPADAFTFHDMRAACLLVKLSQNGVGTARLKTVLAQLRRRYPDAHEALSQLDLFAGLLVIRDDASRLTSPNGQLLMDLEDDGEDSESLSTVAVRLNRFDADSAFESAASLEHSGNLQGALAAYRAYLTQFGPEAAACFNLANVLTALGKTEAAVERYRQAVEIDPDFAVAWNNLGLALASLGELEEATDAWRRAIDSDATLADAVYNLADSLQQANKFVEARKFWAAYLQLDSNSQWAAYARECLGASVA